MLKTLSRRKIQVKGLVQGIGFRPFVYNQARDLGLTGFVRNRGGIVEIEVQGERAQIETFLSTLAQSPPSRSQISEIHSAESSVIEDECIFEIADSEFDNSDSRQVPLDTAVCNECIEEMFEPSDRRYRYPFINCINCGPRFTIIRSLPYDRISTTMDSFSMCGQCLYEYRDPQSRRFHAQPNACSQCGPSLFFQQTHQQLSSGESALQAALEALRQNRAIAVKGLGGYHLMGSATSQEVVAQIRRLKNRPKKPLAVMFKDVEQAASYCFVDADERQLLEGADRPIVLLRCKHLAREKRLAAGINDGLDELGAMLACTPLQHLILNSCDFPLIATSANDDGFPITIDDLSAVNEFENLGVLSNNRMILSGYDDSIVRSRDGKPGIIRRARGQAPGQLSLPFEADKSVLAFGAHLKNTFCLTRKGEARLSQHLGDIETIERLNNWQETLDLYMQLFRIKPDALVCDSHPDYQTSILAKQMADRLNLPLLKVQHHHAHAASVMAEHHLKRVLAVVYDGLGLGDDGNIWGGEFLHCTYENFDRLGHFEYVPMPGGELAVKNPWRMLLGFSHTSRKANANRSKLEAALESFYSRELISAVKQQLDKRINCPITSSCGRLFDAAAALIHPGISPTYEGQAAMELEVLARRCKCAKHEQITLPIEESGAASIIQSTAILDSLQNALDFGMSKECAAKVFHESISAVTVKVLLRLRAKTAVNDVCLAGGVFQNVLLSKLLIDDLSVNGFKVFLPNRLPINDGGLSFGQAVVGLSRLS